MILQLSLKNNKNALPVIEDESVTDGDNVGPTLAERKRRVTPQLTVVTEAHI